MVNLGDIGFLILIHLKYSLIRHCPKDTKDTIQEKAFITASQKTITGIEPEVCINKKQKQNHR